MAISKEKKQTLVESYVEQLNSTQAVVMTDYRGLTVKQFQDLRQRLREQNASIQVVKNSLIKIALERANLPIPEETLVGPTAIAFMPEDVATVAKALFDFAKGVESFAVKGAILETQILNAEEAKGLIDLPTRETVLAQLLGAIQGPASSLVRTIEGPANEVYRTIQAPLRELALTIQAYAAEGSEAGA